MGNQLRCTFLMYICFSGIAVFCNGCNWTSPWSTRSLPCLFVQWNIKVSTNFDVLQTITFLKLCGTLAAWSDHQQ